VSSAAPPPAAEAVHAGLDDLMVEIDDAQQAVAAGHPVTLAGFDGRVGAICAAAETLPVREHAPIARRIAELVERLDRLTGSLADAAEAEDDRQARAAQASAAYRSTGNRDPEG
jgi:hypothetical protein